MHRNFHKALKDSFCFKISTELNTLMSGLVYLAGSSKILRTSVHHEHQTTS